MRKLRAIWITMNNDGLLHDGSEDALGSFIRRMTANANGGVGINRAEWLTLHPGRAGVGGTEEVAHSPDDRCHHRPG